LKKLHGLPFLKAAMQDAKASKVRLRPTRRMDTGNCAEVSTARGFALCGPLYSDRKPLPETATQGLVQVYKQAGLQPVRPFCASLTERGGPQFCRKKQRVLTQPLL